MQISRSHPALGPERPGIFAATSQLRHPVRGAMPGLGLQEVSPDDMETLEMMIRRSVPPKAAEKSRNWHRKKINYSLGCGLDPGVQGRMDSVTDLLKTGVQERVREEIPPRPKVPLTSYRIPKVGPRAHPAS